MRYEIISCHSYWHSRAARCHGMLALLPKPNLVHAVDRCQLVAYDLVCSLTSGDRVKPFVAHYDQQLKRRNAPAGCFSPRSHWLITPGETLR